MSANIIAKKACSYAQPSNLVTVKQLVILEESGERFVVVKLKNERGEYLSAVTLGIVKYDARGKVIGKFKEKIECGCASGQTVVPNKKIAVGIDTVDCKIKVLSAEYGNYTYSASGGVVAVDYAEQKPQKQKDPALDAKVGKNGITVKPRKPKTPVAIVVSLIISVLAATAVAFAYLGYFVRSEPTFLYSGVEYAFVDGNSENSDIVVVGFHGRSSHVVIPSEIEGHKVISFAEKAFAGNASVTSIAFGNDIDIGDYAFDGCKNLRTVEFEKITSVGAGAFRNCVSLESVTITEKTRVVYGGAFTGCTALKSVVIEESDTSLKLGRYAFSQCIIESADILRTIDFSYGNGIRAYFDNSKVGFLHFAEYDVTGDPEDVSFAAMFGDSGTLGALSIDVLDHIPDGFCKGLSLASFKVGEIGSTVIGGYAFTDCVNLTEFTVPVAVTAVGDDAFSYTALSSFDASAVKSFGKNAFAGSALSSVIFTGNDKLSIISDGVFFDCVALERVSIPSSVIEIGNEAFANCSALAEVNCGQNSSLVIVGDGAFRGCSSLKEFESHSSTLTKIGERAFAGCRALIACELPNSIITISDNAFYNTALTDVTIPDGISYVGSGAFAACPLVSFTAPFIGQDESNNGFFAHVFGAVDYNGYGKVPETLKLVTVTAASALYDHAFYRCENIEDIILPSNLTQIGAYAFSGCSGLSDIDIPRGVTELSDYAFADCLGFAEFTVNDGITNIGRGVFKGCNNLKSLSLPFVGASADAVGNTATLAYIVSGEENAQAIGGRNIQSSLETVILTGGTIVDDYAFSNCGYIKNIVLPDNGLIGIGTYAFYACRSLEELTVPNSVLTMGNSALCECDSLESLSLPFFGNMRADEDNYNEYEYSSMLSFTYLTNYSVMRSLKKLTVTDSEYIPYSAVNSIYLEQLVIDCEVTAVGGRAFDGCYKLYELFDYSNSGLDFGNDRLLAVHTSRDDTPLPVIVSGEFRYVAADGKFYLVDCGRFEYSVEFENGVSADGYEFTEYEIWNALMYGDYSVKNLYIPSNVTAVGKYAFYNCDELVSVEFAKDSSVTELGDYVFAFCRSIRSVRLPLALRTIGSGAFQYCTRLKSFTVTSGVRKIEDNAFYNCYRLFEVYDLGSGLNISVGSGDNGCIAQYAASVFTNSNDALDKTTSGGVEYYKLDRGGVAWWAVDVVDDYATALELLPFDYNGETVRKFSVLTDAFVYATSVDSLVLSNALSVIDNEFGNMYRLNNINIVSGGDYESIKISDYAFANKMQLQSFISDVAISEIGMNAFASCKMLANFTVSAHVGTINENVFASGSEILAVELASVDTVGAYAFIGSSLGSFVSGNVTDIGEHAFFNVNSLNTVLIANAKNIGDSAFAYCYSLTSVALGAVERIGNSAFCNCNMLNVLKLSNVENGLTIGDRAFEHCSNITDFVYDGYIVSIGFSAFGGCSSLASITLGICDEISDNAFSGVPVSKLTFKGGIGRIGSYAFAFNSEIKSLAFDGIVSVIADNAFAYCYALESVTFSEGLTSIGYGAFWACSALGSVTLPSTLTTLNNFAFGECYRILSVVNKSDIVLDDGYFTVAPVVISKSETGAKLSFSKAIINGKEFSFAATDGKYTLYDIKGVSSYECFELPEKFTDGGNTVTSYSVRGYSILYSEGCQVIVGKNVTALGINAFGRYPQAVYFKGDEDGFETVDGYENFNTVYFYSECLHDDNAFGNLWRYDGNYPTDLPTVFYDSDYRTVKEPTCTEKGSQEAVCPHCNKTFTRELDTLPHNFNNGECVDCGLKCVQVTRDNFDTLGIFSNDEDNPFDAKSNSGYLLATNIPKGTVVTLTVTADKDMTLEFMCRVSTLGDDYMKVMRGDETLIVVGNYSSGATVELKKSETLTFNFYQISDDANVIASIRDFMIYYREASDAH